MSALPSAAVTIGDGEITIADLLALKLGLSVKVLKSEMQNRIIGLPEIKEVQVELVWDPPWDQSRISREAKLQLGMV